MWNLGIFFRYLECKLHCVVCPPVGLSVQVRRFIFELFSKSAVTRGLVIVGAWARPRMARVSEPPAVGVSARVNPSYIGIQYLLPSSKKHLVIIWG